MDGRRCEMERDVVEPGARGRRGSLCRCGVVTGRNRIGGFRRNAVARISVSSGSESIPQAGTWRAGNCQSHYMEVDFAYL